ncbi:MAG: Na+ dependent nucleoside transporter [Owenweeksia sp.]|nr:Na+ dependent nucleoside transporter [Owenweeksia sp.]MBF98418.1 Na+ dependent nucleoside transporter [Owenweeksia sp.]HBF21214.1 Na+ dependent nucleoside transporter [Cryomorphaceae bacterium]HCQ15013.1 Na+ dependent nucleoside transporter [Cryomorphaceae bacterium]|tara:strand:+ start:2983 stop:4695 length:1713 start_codon:yes stop_codon:yes gene_type:complete
MAVRLLLSFIFSILLVSNSFGQEALKYRWAFQSIENIQGESLLNIDSADYFDLSNDSVFAYSLVAKDSLIAQGSWVFRNDSLIFNYTAPADTLRGYAVTVLNDSTLVINEGNVNYTFHRDPLSSSVAALPLNYDFSKGDITLAAVLRGMLGLLILIAIGFLLSSKRRKINWPLIVKGLIIQIIFALGILKVSFVRASFDWLSSKFVILLNFTRDGSEFLFGSLISDTSSLGYIFAFQVLPTVIFFSALTSLLFYWGILQKIVFAFAWVMKRTMKLSGAESLSAAGNIFLGQTESPLLVKPYIKKMTKSELLCLMSGGMATIAGGVLAAYIGFLGGEDIEQQIFFAKHLLAASVMSAPAAVVAAKLLLPETEKVNESMHIEKANIGSNALEAITNGTTEGLKLAVNVGAMLLVFIAFMAFANYLLTSIIGDIFGLNAWAAQISAGQYDSFSFQFILGYGLQPITWLMGVDWQDSALVGQLLGEKTILNEFVAYVSLGDLMSAGKFASEKSIIIATYILCGFSNFASIGIQIGGIGALAPSRKGDLSKLGFRALIAGTLASLFTAVIVGMLI